MIEVKITNKNYYISPTWKELRAKAIDRDCFCRTCGSTVDLVAHHRSYEHFGEGNQAELNDVVVLCNECHRKIHLPDATKNEMKPRKKKTTKLQRKQQKELLKSIGGLLKK